jgi:predicted esterase
MIVGLVRVVFAAVLLLASCTRPVRSERLESASRRATARLPPLTGPELRPLRDGTRRTVGVVSVPLGAREKRPLVVAVHGAGSRPDGMCHAARWSLGPSPIVVCPHSIESTETEASWGSAEGLRAAIDRAVAAARTELDPYIESEGALYLGHSQGAMLAPSVLALRGRTNFRSAIFFEGLPRDAVRARADLLRARIERLFLVSGQSSWSSGHRIFAESFRGTTVAAKHAHVDAGHFMNGEVHALLRSEMAWVAADAPAWRGHIPPR